jgi:hypothetical protein
MYRLNLDRRLIRMTRAVVLPELIFHVGGVDLGSLDSGARRRR